MIRHFEQDTVLCSVLRNYLDFAAIAVFLRQKERRSVNGVFQFVRLNPQIVSNAFRSHDQRLCLFQDVSENGRASRAGLLEYEHIV